jgi:CheY-like chemotaxis protein
MIARPRRTIAILDDDPQVLEPLSRGLEFAGDETTPIADPIECLNLLQAGRAFDLMIIDIVMPPDMPHGVSVGRIAMRQNPKQKVIYITGRLDWLAEGMVDTKETPVLIKPVRIHELLDVLSKLGVS